MAVPPSPIGKLRPIVSCPLLPGIESVAELAQMDGVRECMQWLPREKLWINEKHLELCRIAAPTFFEQERARWMAVQFEDLGYDAKIDRAGNVTAMKAVAGNEPLVALTAHLDTVLAPRSPDDITVQPDGSMRGAGVSDNGAGLAALLAIAKALNQAPQFRAARSKVVFAANVCEEGEGNLSGMRYLCGHSPMAPRIRGFLILDGPDPGHITAQALASRRFEVSFTGPGGHSWSDFGIGNPVHALSRAVSLFADTQMSGKFPRASYNFGMIEGGVGVNSIPTSARAKLDIRSEYPERISELAALLTASVERALENENAQATGGKVGAKIREIGSRPGGRLAEDASLLRFLRAVDGHLSVRSRVDCASTDANIPLSLNIPAVSIGAGGQGGGAHTPGEWFHPEGRDIGLKRILLTLCLMLAE